MHNKIAQCLKDISEELAQNADKLAPDVENWYDLDIHIGIPTMSDSQYDAPHVDVSYSFYPKRKTIEKWMGVDVP